MYEAEAGTLSIALVGDTILTRKLSVFREPRFLRIREILSGADAVFANLEAAVHRYLDGGFGPSSGGGTYVTTEPELLDELKWLGINMVASGSSHADDYGPDGILQTIRYLDAAGIVHAGSGAHLAEARSPAFLDTPNGRVALIAAASPHSHAARAMEQRHDTAGFPGINGLRHRVVHEVDRETLDTLRSISRSLGWDAEVQRLRALGMAIAAPSPDSYNFLDRNFVVGPKPSIRTIANQNDLRENLRQIRHAKAMADRVIVSFHCHEQGGPTYQTAEKRSEVEELADFAVDFAHQAIDAGADIFVGHGPQAALGVEIYKGKPIFYGIGTFIFQLETVEFLPDEPYERYGLEGRASPSDFVETRYAGETRGHPADAQQWQQFFPTCKFDAAGVCEIKLYPIELGFRKARSQRGRPLLAEIDIGRTIIERVARLSRRYGTEIAVEDGVGVVRL